MTYDEGYADGQLDERKLMRDMRHDYQTLPHREFPVKWPKWKEYEEVLPTTCSCQDCSLWRTGS